MISVLKGLLVFGVVAGLASAGAPATNATSNNNCVDGSVRSNLTFEWNSRESATVGTVNNKPLCADVDIYLSSYTMPDNYNGERFSNNPTATPQYVHASTLYTLKKGSTEPVTMTVSVPDECTNVQSDIYYPPEVREVNEKGHPSDQIINGKIFAATQDDCTPDEPETPVVEEPKDEPQILATSDVKELPRTGATSNLLLGLVGAVGTYATVYRLRK